MEQSECPGLESRILELEEQVQTLESELSDCQELEEQLAQAQKMEALASLSGGIAHDFNNILHCILGYTEMALLEKSGDNPDYEILKQIQSIVMKGRDLAQQLLVFGRKMHRQPVLMNINAVVLEVERMLRRTMPRMIEIDRRLDDNLYYINADTGQCEQIVMNLCLNAMDALPEGGRMVLKTENLILKKEDSAHIRLDIPPGVYVRLTVADTGQGMAPETIRRIFEPFFTTKEKGRGTGLGLSVVYSIVNNHHGYIDCQTRKGEGTKFQIYFPALDIKGTEYEKQKNENFIGSFAGKESILFIEDEIDILGVGQKFLQECGYSVLTAQSGEEGLDLYRSHSVDLVLMDVGMPGMGGIEFLKTLLSVNADAKVLIISGYSAKSRTIEALRLGSESFLAKPFKREELLKRVRTVLDRN